MEFRPCIDLHGGKVKQIVGSTLNDRENPDTNFISGESSAFYARMYQEDGLTGGHVIMLGPGNESAALEALEAYPGGLQLGGGLHAGNGRIFLDHGARQLIFTSFIFSGGELKLDHLQQLRQTYGRDKIVLDLSCRKRDGIYYIVTDRWQKFTEFALTEENFAFLGGYASEFLIHAVDVEGKLAGVDRELISLIAAMSPVETVYAGGVTTLDDVRLVRQLGKGRVHFTIGSALDIFGGPLAYREVVDFCAATRN